jgi:hypothetical protein
MNQKPSLTELLDLLNKPALIRWANGLGKKGIDVEEYRNEQKSQGRELHNQIHEFHKYGIPLIDLELNANYAKFISDKEVIDSEIFVEHELFVCRYDIKLKVAGDIVIGDFKSSDRIYLENILQLTGERMAVVGCKLAIIEIPSFRYKPLNIRDYTPYEEILKALVTIYHNKKLVE